MNIYYCESFIEEQIATITAFDKDKPGIMAGSSTASYCLDPSGAWYFNRLYVRPEYRRNGIACELIKKMLKYFVTFNIPLILDINPYGDMSYEQLESFYLKNGFQKHEEECGTVYYFNEEYMRKEN